MEATSKSAHSCGMSAFVLKIIACVTMAIDHIGASLLPDVYMLRIIGRLAFPLFAFFIAEGCRYTRNKPKRFLLVFGLAVICEAGYFIISQEITGTALLTFSCSIPIIYALQFFKKSLVQKKSTTILLSGLTLGATVAVAYVVSELVPIDYGFPGVLLPVLVSLFDYREGEAPLFLRRLDRHVVRMALFAVGVLLVWYFRGQTNLQLHGILALLPLAFYNGKPGVRTRKYWFYIFYPAHLAIIKLIELLINR